MPTSPNYLPVYTLSESTSPTTADYIVSQAAGSNGDVGLINIATFIDKFSDDLIDPLTVTAFLNNGWVAPT